MLAAFNTIAPSAIVNVLESKTKVSSPSKSSHTSLQALYVPDKACDIVIIIACVYPSLTASFNASVIFSILGRDVVGISFSKRSYIISDVNSILSSYSSPSLYITLKGNNFILFSFSNSTLISDALSVINAIFCICFPP